MVVTEQIVEVYYKECKNCLTVNDVKVIKGEGRQLDLLAFEPNNEILYHVESSVSITHDKFTKDTIEKISRKFEYKFLGNERHGKASRGKNFLNNINETYTNLGFKPKKIIRILCSWTKNDLLNRSIKDQLSDKYNLDKGSIDFLSFRDEVIPEILSKIGTSNYENEMSRSFSLFKAFLKSIPTKDLNQSSSNNLLDYILHHYQKL